MQPVDSPARRFLEKLTGNPEMRERLQAAIERMEEHQAQGQPAAAAPKPCGICGGTGLLQTRAFDPTKELPPPLEPCYACQKGQEQERYAAGLRLSTSGMDAYRAWTFARTVPSPDQEGAFRAAQEWAEAKIPGSLQDQPFLWLTGPYYTGKTRAAACVGNLWLDRGDDVIFRLETTLYNDLRATYDDSSDSVFSVELGRLQRVPYLILDDVGKAKETPFVIEQRFSLCDYRLTRGLPTVITTNILLDEIDERLPRLAPRIMREDRCDALIIPMEEAYRAPPLAEARADDS